MHFSSLREAERRDNSENTLDRHIPNGVRDDDDRYHFIQG
jgi:hypothetical protein